MKAFVRSHALVEVVPDRAFGIIEREATPNGLEPARAVLGPAVRSHPFGVIRWCPPIRTVASGISLWRP
jgi:hypothetical protein